MRFGREGHTSDVLTATAGKPGWPHRRERQGDWLAAAGCDRPLPVCREAGAKLHTPISVSWFLIAALVLHNFNSFRGNLLVPHFPDYTSSIEFQGSVRETQSNVFPFFL